MILRDYQVRLIEDARQAMRGSRAVLIQAATGAGKTALASSMVRGAADKGKRTFFTVHRKDLLKQTAGAFDEAGLCYSYIASGHDLNPYAKTHICSIDTLKNRLGKVPNPDVLFVDECHMANSEGWSKVINFYRQAGAYIVGLSATPWRLDGSGLGDNFDAMVQGPSMAWLIENKYLSEYRYFAPSRPDLSGVGTVAGDYNKGQLAAMMEADAVITGDAIKHYKKYCDGLRTICYCVSRRHSEQTVARFNDAGIAAAHIDGETTMAERARLIGLFASGVIKVLCNVELITTGFDLAAQIGRAVAVQAIILLRPTKSLSLYLQMVGRGLRYDGDTHIILDHAGCALTHGLPADEREWSLVARERRRGGGAGVVPVRQCGACFYCHKPAPVCPDCGNVYEVKYRKVDEVEGELDELTAVMARKERNVEMGMAKSLDALIVLGRQRGYKNPEFWAAKVMSGRAARR